MAQESEILTLEQKQFLDLVAAESYFRENYYFTGGTPLAAFYLQHRFSEDIDLFCEQEIDLAVVRPFIGKVQKKMKVKQVDYRQFLGLHSFQLIFNKTKVLKVDFNYYPFQRIEKGVSYQNLPVDSILDIAVNKVHTIALQPRARDFIDIYFIVQKEKYDLHRLLMLAKAKFDWHIDPIQLGSRLITAKDVKDFPRMIKKIDHIRWQEFFVEEARKLKKEIFE